jgi:AraC-like DNA-binding protein
VEQGFSTAGVALGERVDYWREMVRRHFVALRIEPLADGEFDGAARLRSVGELDIARVRARPMRATRTCRHIERSGSDEYFVGLHLHGLAHCEQGGRTATLRPGDFALFDSARPYSIAFSSADSFDHLIVRIPREQLEARIAQLERATAVTVPAGSIAGQMAAPALTTLSSMDGGGPFVEATLDLIAAAVRHTIGFKAPSPFGRHASLTRTKRFALAHLHEADLSPTRVAQECFISTRQLHRLFAGEGTTFTAFVREARLERVRRDLADASRAALTVADIGRRHGYRHPPALTRAFTSRYGVGPRAFRQSEQSRMRGADVHLTAARTSRERRSGPVTAIE